MRIEAPRNNHGVTFTIATPPLGKVKIDRVVKECLKLVKEIANLSQLDLIAELVSIRVNESLMGGRMEKGYSGSLCAMIIEQIRLTEKSREQRVEDLESPVLYFKGTRIDGRI
ncbi:MAG: hypothetical protein QXY49_00145 [Thermofilaceae archaeon]